MKEDAMYFPGGRRVLGSVAAVAMVLGAARGVGRTQYGGGAQSPGMGQNPMSTLPDVSGTRDQDDPMRRSSVERQAKMRSEERQKRLVADSEKLLALANQLHDDVAKTDRNILSLDVVKRADEIEKLAHAVKEREKE